MARKLEFDATMQTRVDSKVLKAAKKAALANGMSLSAYMRNSLDMLAATADTPKG